MFKVKFEDGTVVLPNPFKVKVKKWLGNNEKNFQEIYKQVNTIYADFVIFLNVGQAIEAISVKLNKIAIISR